VTPSFIRKLKAEGNEIGTTLEQYKENIDRPLSAILTLNTIAHTVGAIGVGAQAGALFGEHELDLGPIHMSYEAVIAGLMTLAILILSEIIPKTIGANMWRKLTPFAVVSIRVLLIVLYPFVWMSEFITSRLKKDKEMSVFSRSDFAAMVHEGEVSGAIQQSESTIIKNLIKLNKLTVRDIMTPRTVVLMAPEDKSLQEFYEKHKPLRFSRIPIYEGWPDHLTGVVLKDDILEKLALSDQNIKLQDIKKPIHVIHDSKTLDNLMEELASNKTHLAGVMDENGVLVGVVTMEDLIETILGLEIMDETDSVEDLQKLARKRWEERAKKLGVV
jgi:CBS domain containing-hemolysin-like protein